MDAFTRLNSAAFRKDNMKVHVLLQRAYMKAWKLAKPRQTFRTKFGSVMRGSITDYVPARICFFGSWEPNLTRFMETTIKPGDTVVDLGANIGYFTLLMSKLVGPAGHVISIEAAPASAAILRENVAMNGGQNVAVKEIAVAEKPGEIKLFHSRWGNTNTGAATLVEGRGSDRYDVVKTDTLLNILGDDASRVSFIKIDIEGAELPVLHEIIANRPLLGKRLTIVSEIEAANMHIVDRFKSSGFNAGFIENDYSIDAYLRESTDGLRPFEGKRPETADMVFQSGI
jgi:FkbM family methyltransferase